MRTVATSPQRILSTLQAYRDAAALNTAIELDLFTIIGKGAETPAKMASSIGIPAHGVRLLCEYLAGAGLLIKEDEQFRLSDDAAAFLDTRSPDYLGDSAKVLHQPQLLRSFEKLTESVRAGLPVIKDDTKLAPRPEWFHAASGVAHQRNRAQRFADAIGLPSGTPLKILTVGDDAGTLGIELASRCPQRIVVALDSPSALATAHQRAQSAKLATRYQDLPGDALEAPLGYEFDVAVIADLFRFNYAQIMSLLMRIQYALKKSGKLFVLDFLAEEAGESLRTSAGVRLNLLTATDRGDVTSVAEVTQLLGSTGYQSVEVLTLPEACATLVSAHT